MPEDTRQYTWADLTHDERIDLLRRSDDDEIIALYQPPGVDTSSFQRQLTEWRQMYNPSNVGQLSVLGDAPSKETLFGAVRDLDRTEALLELIDNSIDAWKRREKLYPNLNAKELHIYIDLDQKTGVLTYEDNAGGVPKDNLINLVIPGHSETGDTSRTIGSYKTGGKKAVFKLATEAKIESYYWNPAQTTDEAWTIHLDRDWIEDQTAYKFPAYLLTNKGSLNVGQTVYSLRLRDPNMWGVLSTNAMRLAMQRTYTLLLAKNPNIKIHFLNRTQPLEPLEDLYVFTSAHTDNFDLRPQRVIFKMKLPWRGFDYELEIEVVLGCRTTTAAKKGEDSWGFDLYGNDRLFRLHDQDEVLTWFAQLPTGNARMLMRGLINIHGPNVFIPWDTHKRHLNIDREVVQKLKSHPMIQELFSEWIKTWKIVGNSSDEIKSVVENRIPAFRQASGKRGRDINVTFESEVGLSEKKQGAHLPKSVHRPQFPAGRGQGKTGGNLDVRLPISAHDYRRIRQAFKLNPMADDPKARRELGQEVLSYLINQIERGKPLA